MLPITTTLGVRRHGTDGRDAHNRSIPTWSAPQSWPVHALAPGANTEPGEPDRDLSLIVWTVYAPANDKLPGELDRVVVDGVEYEVEGRARDWSRGPWPNPVAGVVVELKRAEG